LLLVHVSGALDVIVLHLSAEIWVVNVVFLEATVVGSRMVGVFAVVLVLGLPQLLILSHTWFLFVEELVLLLALSHA